jgi:hypothetical protein
MRARLSALMRALGAGVALGAGAALGAGLVAAPAAAQFNPFEAIFGALRPPADVPGRGPPDRLPPGPPPSQQYPPSARLPPGPPPSQQYPQQNPDYPGQYPGYPPQYPARPDVQRDQLPPPPGAAPPGTALAPQQGLPPRSPPPPRQARQTPSGVPEQPPDQIITPPIAKINNPTAVFSGLDKITGRIISFDVAINETVQFGALQVTPRACYTRPPTETQVTDSFLEVDEVTLQGEVRRIFTGWMFAASPGLHAVEHSIYDVWLVDCKGGSTVVAESPPGAGAAGAVAGSSGDAGQPAAQPAPPAQRPRQQQQQRPRQPPPLDPFAPR